MNPPDPTPEVADATPRGCTNLKLRQLMRRVGQLYDVELARAGLKTTQYSLLSHVMKLGPLRPGDLAKAMKMDASTLSRNLRPLLEAGWLTLGAGADARSRSVALTPAGLAKREQARACWRAAQDALNRQLGVQQVLALHATLDAALALLDSAQDLQP